MMGITQQRMKPDGAHVLSTNVIYAIAEQEGVDPMQLDPPLFEAVDLDALEALFSTSGTPSVDNVTFSYNGYEVSVSGTDDVEVSPTG